MRVYMDAKDTSSAVSEVIVFLRLQTKNLQVSYLKGLAHVEFEATEEQIRGLTFPMLDHWTITQIDYSPSGSYAHSIDLRIGGATLDEQMQNIAMAANFMLAMLQRLATLPR